MDEDKKKVLEVLKAELKRWNSDQLHVAFDICDKKYVETRNGWWLHLLDTVTQEIIDRGGRR